MPAPNWLCSTDLNLAKIGVICGWLASIVLTLIFAVVRPTGGSALRVLGLLGVASLVTLVVVHGAEALIARFVIGLDKNDAWLTFAFGGFHLFPAWKKRQPQKEIVV